VAREPERPRGRAGSAPPGRVTGAPGKRSNDESEASYYFDLGDRYRLQKRWADAAAAYRNGLALDQSEASQHFWLGYVSYRMSDLATAVAAFREAIDRNPTDATWHYRLGRALQEAERWDEAASAYQAAIDRNPTHATWHYRLGRALQEAERWDEAASAYQAAIDRNPTHATWHFRLGYVSQRDRNWLAAIKGYQGAVLREPARADWHYRLGYAYERMRSWPEATQAFRMADRCAARATEGATPPPTKQLPYISRVYLSLVPRPAYAYGLFRSASLARELGVQRITAVEIGVAGGNGLLALEQNAAEVAELTGVAIEVVGFDTGTGLLEPADYRDMPYFFQAGLYRMDVAQLKERLTRAQLVLGDAARTISEFLQTDPAPIGFASFDMDVYSSTHEVLRNFDESTSHTLFLPRTNLYFDDVTGTQGQYYNEFTGELLAIEEYNARNSAAKIAEDRTFRTLPMNTAWHHGAFVLHRFEHPSYNTFVSPATSETLSLRG
jgi:Flp pilus assembly protein TadD